MKNNLSKLFVFVFLSFFILLLTGCGGNKISDKAKDIINETEEQIKEDIEKDSEVEKENNTNNELDDIKLYSDDTKIVFNMNDIYYAVFYHDGTNITGLEYVYDYQDLEVAKFNEKILKAGYETESDVEKVERVGTKIRIKYKEEAYRGQTLESVKESYSYLEEIKQN